MSVNKNKADVTPAILRAEYNITNRGTWSEWIRPLVKKKIVRAHAKKYTPAEVLAIRTHLGTA